MTASLVAATAALLALSVGLFAVPAPAQALEQPFARGGIWNAPIPADAAVDPRSRAMVAGLVEQVARERATRSGPWINSNSFTTTVYTVPANQPTVRVRLVNHTPDPALEAAWTDVPLPTNARPSNGSDQELTVWQPTTNRLWEFWHLTHTPNGWQAQWGGAMNNVSTNPGYFTTTSWPGAKTWWGATATSLPLLGGLIRTDELRRGTIDHALALAIPNPRATTYTWPAQRTDGNNTDPTSIPEGTRLRLDPTLDLTRLNLPPTGLAIARAAQRYGILIRDRSANIAFYAEDQTPTGTDPYHGPTGIYAGKWPDQLLTNFPWHKLQALSAQQEPAG